MGQFGENCQLNNIKMSRDSCGLRKPLGNWLLMGGAVCPTGCLLGLRSQSLQAAWVGPSLGDGDPGKMSTSRRVCADGYSWYVHHQILWLQSKPQQAPTSTGDPSRPAASDSRCPAPQGRQWLWWSSPSTSTPKQKDMSYKLFNFSVISTS